MIICHRHRFVFIKTRKTAGSSTEMALSRACDAGDIVTPLSERLGEEEIRQAEGGQPPVNWAKSVMQHRGFREWRRLLTRGQRSPRFSQHATAAEIRDWLGVDVWRQYLTFTIERNPWDRAVSRYWWQKFRWEKRGKKNFPDLSEYLQWLAENKPHWISNWIHYADGDDILVNRVLFYETLASDLAQLSRELNLAPEQFTLPRSRAKSGFRPERAHYSDCLSADDCELIRQLCWREISAFGYTREQGSRSPLSNARPGSCVM